MTKEELKDLKIELAARKIIRRKLESNINALEPAILKTVEAREARKEQLSEYKNYNDLQDAYGWGFITEEEFDTLAEALENGIEQIDKEISAHEIAKQILSGWLKITNGDIYDLEFQLLSPKKQKEIRDRSYEIEMKRKERRESKDETRTDL